MNDLTRRDFVRCWAVANAALTASALAQSRNELKAKRAADTAAYATRISLERKLR